MAKGELGIEAQRGQGIVQTGVNEETHNIYVRPGLKIDLTALDIPLTEGDLQTEAVSIEAVQKAKNSGNRQSR